MPPPRPIARIVFIAADGSGMKRAAPLRRHRADTHNVIEGKSVGFTTAERPKSAARP
jgi:hypothetical protein